MAWVMLGIAGIFEVVWATCMKYSDGFTNLGWSLLAFAGMAVSFFLLALFSLHSCLRCLLFRPGCFRRSCFQRSKSALKASQSQGISHDEDTA